MRFRALLAAILALAAVSSQITRGEERTGVGPLAISSLPKSAQPDQRTGAVPRVDRVIVIVMENKSYDAVRFAPFTAQLISSGTSFSNSFGVTHPSTPNYLALWSGSTQGVTSNSIPPRGSPFDAENLGHACETAGLSWKAYEEDLPYAGFSGSSWNHLLYARKHAPWTNFANLDHRNELPFSELAIAESLGKLPNLAVAIPNQRNDTHDAPVSLGDGWLAEHVPGMLRALGKRGLLVLTWDEDDSKGNNHILTVFNGPVVKPNYISPRPISHYTVLRTVCDALGIAPPGAAATETPVTDAWRSDETPDAQTPMTNSTGNAGR